MEEDPSQHDFAFCQAASKTLLNTLPKDTIVIFSDEAQCNLSG